MNLKAVSIFSGAGFADYALHEAAKMLGIEIEIIAAYDNWDKAVDVYNLNLPPVAQIKDINELKELPDCDFVFGGPPCVGWSIAGRKLGKKDPRDCTDKTWELVQGHNYLLENVQRVFPDSPHIVGYTASDFGDCTKRHRFFHSNLPISGAPHLFEPTTIGQIREPEEDIRIYKKRGLVEKAGNHKHYTDDEVFHSFTAHSWHGHDIRGYGKLVPLKLTLRGYSKHVRPYDDDEILGTLVGNTWHGNNHITGCRNPSILEMQRAHSIPEEWNWGKTVNKNHKGKIIANGWPIRMGISVFHAFLNNFIKEEIENV